MFANSRESHIKKLKFMHTKENILYQRVNQLVKMSSSYILFVLLIVVCLSITEAAVVRGLSASAKRTTCNHEIGNANRTMVDWGSTMRQMITESALPTSKDNAVAKEAKKVQELIENLSANLNRRPIEQTVKDLVTIRRRSNQMALDIYLKTLDMRWPQTSVRLGVAVERVQQACLSNPDRAAMMVLNPSYSKSQKF